LQTAGHPDNHGLFLNQKQVGPLYSTVHYALCTTCMHYALLHDTIHYALLHYCTITLLHCTLHTHSPYPHTPYV
jgi:hypothetical protein